MKNLLFSISILLMTLGMQAQGWQLYTQAPADDLNCVYIIGQDVFVGGDQFGIWHSRAGSAFTMLTPNQDGIADITFTSPSEGWAVGDDGLILRSTDSGSTWLSIASGTSNDLQAINFADSATAYIVGRDGTILKSVNSGQSWNTLSSGTLNRLEDVWFTATDTGFVAGRNGSMLYTVNGGQNWSNMGLGTGDFNSIYFYNDGWEGYIAGEDGIFKTQDRGLNWMAINDTLLGEINSIVFDHTVAYTAGELGIIGKSVTQGYTWSIDTIFTMPLAEWNDLAMSSGMVIAVGDSGMMAIKGSWGGGGQSGAAHASFYLDSTLSGGANLYLYNNSSPSFNDPAYTVSYHWNFGDGDTSNLPFPTHVYANPGRYAICLTVNTVDIAGQFSTDIFCDTLGIDSAGNVIYKKAATGFTLIVLDPNAIGVDESQMSTCSIYPNPSSGSLNIQLTTPGSKAWLRIFNLSGQLLTSTEVSDQENIQLENLKKGVYLVQLLEEGWPPFSTGLIVE